MKRAIFVLAALAACSVWSVPPDVTTLPAASQTVRTGAAQLRRGGLSAIERGEFRRGVDLLTQSLALEDDETVAKARDLTARHIKARQLAEAERKVEYAAAVRRVELARLVAKHRPALVEAKLDEKLFKGMEAVADALAGADNVYTGRTTSRPADPRKVARDSLTLAQEKLATTLQDAEKAPADWLKLYRQAGRRADAALAAYRDVWEKAELPGDRQALKAASEKAKEPLIDMGVLVSRDPMLVGLSHVREAKALADVPEEFLQQPWVASVMVEARKVGRKHVEDRNWLDALAIYGRSGLSELDKDNTEYERTVKRIRQQLRLVGLYGNNGAKTTTAPARANDARWREMIRGIDSVMVRNAISQIESNYVKSPDYREIGIGALEAIRDLLATPEVESTFESLEDTKEREAFRKGLDKQIAQMAKEPIVDHLHVIQALNRTVDLNADTVDLPSEVINMEFAEGMLGKLDDFTSMIWPYQVEGFRKRTMGSFFGIGIQIRKLARGPIEVISPLSDTPAVKAGIRAGDWIIRVDGKETKDISIEAAVRLIAGPLHTEVMLTIRRPGVPEPFDVAVVRDEIHMRTVKGWRRLPGGAWDYMIDGDAGIGYLRLTQFTKDTAGQIGRSGDLQKALKKLKNAKTRALILDLRFNPGGLLDQSERVANEFLRRGLIVRTKGRNVGETRRNADGLGEYLDKPLIVLVNRYSASAAEIVSGALKDWGRAKILGERTYGKGVVQRVVPLKISGQARLKVTQAYYYLPSGRCVQRTNGAKVWGVDPDMPVRVTARQTDRWAEIRQETEVLQSVEADELEALLAHQLREDLQLRTALLLLRLRLLDQQG